MQMIAGGIWEPDWSKWRSFIRRPLRMCSRSASATVRPSSLKAITSPLTKTQCSPTLMIGSDG